MIDLSIFFIFGHIMSDFVKFCPLYEVFVYKNGHKSVKHLTDQFFKAIFTRAIFSGTIFWSNFLPYNFFLVQFFSGSNFFLEQFFLRAIFLEQFFWPKGPKAKTAQGPKGSRANSKKAIFDRAIF